MKLLRVCSRFVEDKCKGEGVGRRHRQSTCLGTLGHFSTPVYILHLSLTLQTLKSLTLTPNNVSSDSSRESRCELPVTLHVTSRRAWGCAVGCVGVISGNLG